MRKVKLTKKGKERPRKITPPIYLVIRGYGSHEGEQILAKAIQRNQRYIQVEIEDENGVYKDIFNASNGKRPNSDDKGGWKIDLADLNAVQPVPSEEALSEVELLGEETTQMSETEAMKVELWSCAGVKYIKAHRIRRFSVRRGQLEYPKEEQSPCLAPLQTVLRLLKNPIL